MLPVSKWLIVPLFYLRTVFPQKSLEFALFRANAEVQTLKEKVVKSGRKLILKDKELTRSLRATVSMTTRIANLQRQLKCNKEREVRINIYSLTL